MEGFLLHDSPESVSGDQLGRAVRPNAAELHQIVLPFSSAAGNAQDTDFRPRSESGSSLALVDRTCLVAESSSST